MITAGLIVTSVVAGAASTAGAWMFNKVVQIGHLKKRVAALEAAQPK